MLPSPEQFASHVGGAARSFCVIPYTMLTLSLGELGISETDHVVVWRLLWKAAIICEFDRASRSTIV